MSGGNEKIGGNGWLGRLGRNLRSPRGGISVKTETAEVIDHPRLGEVTLAQSPRARHISIRVRATGAVRLAYPFGVSRQRALAFLDEKADWILAAQDPRSAKPASRSCAGPPGRTFRSASPALRPPPA